jgi:Holliday junction DNA helicase RuvB
MLYEAMEDSKLSVTVCDGIRTKLVTVRIPRFTLMGATTDPDLLPNALRSRFRILGDLQYYGTGDLMKIVLRAAKAEGIEASDEAAQMVAEASLGTPRVALRLWSRVRDFVVARACNPAAPEEARACNLTGPELARACMLVGVEEARAGLRSVGVDERGLGPVHQQALSILKARGPGVAVGTARLAAMLGLHRRTFQIYQDDLQRLDLIAVTPRGLVTV